MVEQQLEGDNVSDLVFIALWARPGSWLNFFLQLLLSWFLQWRLTWILVTPPTGGWMGGLTSPFPHVQSPKLPSVIILMGSGLLHQFGPPKRLHRAISSQPTRGGYQTFSPHLNHVGASPCPMSCNIQVASHLAISCSSYLTHSCWYGCSQVSPTWNSHHLESNDTSHQCAGFKSGNFDSWQDV
jgi:hypothetical protein